MDLAVAFIGSDWKDLLAAHTGRLRVICWLSSTSTNPFAVADMMAYRAHTEVRQRDAMHCKVYLSPKVGAIIGSANLSSRALSDSEISGQDEAAILVNDRTILAGIQNWFQRMWNDTRTKRITRHDLFAAQRAWRINQARLRSGVRKHQSSAKVTRVPPLPQTIDPTILRFAKQVRSLNLSHDIGSPVVFVKSIDPSGLTRREHRELVEQISAWTKHPGAYKTFLRQRLSVVRRGLLLLFDDSRELEIRLQEIQDKGMLKGLGMPTSSQLLYWRSPERFVPYNVKTARFLRDFKLLHRGMSASTPRCYVKWLKFAFPLAQRLKLPTLGHLDRLVQRYHDSKYGE